jgi:hypothetical protein
VAICCHCHSTLLAFLALFLLCLTVLHTFLFSSHGRSKILPITLAKTDIGFVVGFVFDRNQSFHLPLLEPALELLAALTVLRQVLLVILVNLRATEVFLRFLDKVLDTLLDTLLDEAPLLIGMVFDRNQFLLLSPTESQT